MPPNSGGRGSIGMDSLEKHHHTPLSSEDYIPILILSPSLKKVLIQCSLREVSLSKPETKYEALSYGLLVTPKCLNALIHLWRRFRARALWIDAICVDQGRDGVSTRARNLRIPRGPKANANPSVAWIFPRTPDQKTAAELLEFSQRSWFFRIWTVQETAFAKGAVVQGAHGTAHWELSVMDPRIAASNSCSSRPVEVSMLTAVLRYLPNLPYQVDHDKVFGVYAILKKRLDLPDPDYARPIQEVFQAVAGSYIIDAGSLASLWMTLPLRSSMGLPSWVPDCLPSPTSSSNVDTTGTFDVRSEIRTAGHKLHVPARHIFDRKQQAKLANVCRRWYHSIRLDWPESPHEFLGMMIFCTSWYIDNDNECELLAWYHMVLLRVHYIGKPVSRVFSGYNALTKAHSRAHTRATFGAHYALIKLDNNLHGRRALLISNLRIVEGISESIVGYSQKGWVI
ncbi:hypothetical protein M0657_010593 [Pyricularia oryzae]|nr:hypothetical protein M9X92_011335 [Pyricularia oryzae]KAI7912165.1 hypothetical protein M0657_010593 [Pyricularia oryzae]